MSERAARAAVVVALAVAGCGGGEKTVVDNYFNAVRAGDNQTLSSFAAVSFSEPVESWRIESTRDEAAVPVTLPALAARVKEVEAKIAANKKEAGAYQMQKWADIQKVNELKQKGSAVPAGLTAVQGQWESFTQKNRDLGKQLAAAKAELEKEKRTARLSVGDLDGLEEMQGEVLVKHVDLQVTSKGQAKPYLMTLKKYEIKRDQGPRAMSRWVVQDLKPRT
jgi:PHD/YefM family antitoxin component YafN of YafNO toxin-antitoxin module